MKIDTYSNGDKYLITYPYVKIKANENITAYKIRSIGIGYIEDRFVIGYLEKSNILVKDPSKCSAILVVDNVKNLKEIEEYIKNSGNNLNNICITKGEL